MGRWPGPSTLPLRGGSARWAGTTSKGALKTIAFFPQLDCVCLGSVWPVAGINLDKPKCNLFFLISPQGTEPGKQRPLKPEAKQTRRHGCFSGEKGGDVCNTCDGGREHSTGTRNLTGASLRGSTVLLPRRVHLAVRPVFFLPRCHISL